MLGIVRMAAPPTKLVAEVAAGAEVVIPLPLPPQPTAVARTTTETLNTAVVRQRAVSIE